MDGSQQSAAVGQCIAKPQAKQYRQPEPAFPARAQLCKIHISQYRARKKCREQSGARARIAEPPPAAPELKLPEQPAHGQETTGKRRVHSGEAGRLFCPADGGAPVLTGRTKRCGGLLHGILLRRGLHGP